MSKFKQFLTRIGYKLYKNQVADLDGIYNCYDLLLNIHSKYYGNDIFAETQLFLRYASIKERINDLNHYCNYHDDDDIINDAPSFHNIDDIRVMRRVSINKSNKWLDQLYYDILEYVDELIDRLDIDINDFQS